MPPIKAKSTRVFVDLPPEIHVKLARLALNNGNMHKGILYRLAMEFAACHPAFTDYLTMADDNRGIVALSDDDGDPWEE